MASINIFLLGTLMLLLVSTGLKAEEITFTASDGGVVYADAVMAPAGKSAPLLILFHQAGGDGRAEYSYAAPRFVEAGYSVLLVDQRSGGDRFGGPNRTVAARGESAGYCEAYPDLEGALSYAQESGYAGPIFAAGSSYSAALVIKLGAEHASELAGVIAFSPASGGPMKNCSPNGFAATTKTPTMVLRPATEMRSGVALRQFQQFTDAGHTMYIANRGIHGASMLDPTRTKADVEATWAAVLEFLKAQS